MIGIRFVFYGGVLQMRDKQKLEVGIATCVAAWHCRKSQVSQREPQACMCTFDIGWLPGARTRLLLRESNGCSNQLLMLYNARRPLWGPWVSCRCDWCVNQSDTLMRVLKLPIYYLLQASQCPISQSVDASYNLVINVGNGSNGNR